MLVAARGEALDFGFLSDGFFAEGEVAVIFETFGEGGGGGGAGRFRPVEPIEDGGGGEGAFEVGEIVAFGA